MGNNIEILALGFPIICSLLQTPVALEQHPHLQDLELADDSPLDHDSDTIDILIGSNYYWNIATGSILRGSHGRVAFGSNLGWLLSEPSDSMESGYAVSNLVVEGMEVDNGSSQDDFI